MSEQNTAPSGSEVRRSPYWMGIVAAIIGYSLALEEPAIRGIKLWAIFVCASFTVWICVLKLRNVIHGTGWVFPQTTTAILFALSLEAGLHLLFSH
jgi:hypothetical protein